MDLREQNDIIVYFNDHDLILDVDKFYLSVKQIYERKKQMLNNPEANKFLVSSNLDVETNETIQTQFDYINNLMDNELVFIKEHQFDDVWKFGIAYSKEETTTVVGVYMIRKGENNLFFKDFDLGDSHIFISRYKNDSFNLQDIINKYISTMVKYYFTKSFIQPKFLPDIVLEEIAFEFLDVIARYCPRFEKEGFPCVYYKDTEYVLVIKKLWDSLIKLSFELLAKMYKGSYEKDYPFDPLYFLQGNTKMKELFYQIYDSDSPRYQYPFDLRIEGKFGYNLLLETVKELEKRKITAVTRVWKHKDYLNFMKDLKGKSGLDCIETGYRISDFYLNLDKLLILLPENYDFVSRKLLKRHHDIIRIKRECNIWYYKNADFSCVNVNLKSDKFLININPFPNMASKKSIEELRKMFPSALSTGYGELPDVFKEQKALFNLIHLLIHKSLCDKLQLEFNYSDISFLI